jgi:hypothetical protein
MRDADNRVGKSAAQKSLCRFINALAAMRCAAPVRIPQISGVSAVSGRSCKTAPSPREFPKLGIVYFLRRRPVVRLRARPPHGTLTAADLPRVPFLLKNKKPPATP